MTQHLPTRAQTARGIGVALGAAALLSLTTMLAQADDSNARKILKAMSDYMAAAAASTGAAAGAAYAIRQAAARWSSKPTGR